MRGKGINESTGGTNNAPSLVKGKVEGVLRNTPAYGSPRHLKSLARTKCAEVCSFAGRAQVGQGILCHGYKWISAGVMRLHISS